MSKGMTFTAVCLWLFCTGGSTAQNLSFLTGKWVSVTPGPGLGEPVIFLQNVASWDAVIPGVGLTSVRVSDGTAGSNLKIEGTQGSCYYFVNMIDAQEMVWALRQGAPVCIQSGDFKRIRTEDVEKGLTSAIENQQGRGLTEHQVAQAQRTAEAAQATFAALDKRHPNNRFKLLWVDDQPSNNTDLIYALEALGIIVITVEDTDKIARAFDVSKGFDLVITDMFRDAVRGKPNQPTAGLDTAAFVKRRYGEVPVLIYSSAYATEHHDETLVAPVMAITNKPDEVIQIAVRLARQKGL